MTEAQWHTCTNPNEMLGFVEPRAAERKLRLLAVACCRRVWDLVRDERSRAAVEAAERYADGRTGADELAAAHRAAAEAHAEAGDTRPEGPAAAAAMVASGPWRPHKAANFTALVRPFRSGPHAGEDVAAYKAAVLAEWAWQADVVRDIFGNPFRATPIDPAWQDAQVVSLAEAIYERQAFDRLPALAEALERAGCTDADAWVHCGEPGPHARGCWVVDRILRKA